MICPSFQFEIIYEPILNFHQVYRKAMSPFSRLADSTEILDIHSLKETLHLEFHEEKFDIFCNLESLLFRTQEDLSRFTKSAQSPIRVFYEILDKFREFDTFGNVKSYTMTVEYLNPLLTENVNKNFTTDFLKKNRFGDYQDGIYAGISFSKQKGSRRQDILVSTYNEQIRSEQLQNSFPIDKSAAFRYLDNQQGYHLFYKVHENAPTDVSFKLFIDLINESLLINEKYGNAI